MTETLKLPTTFWIIAIVGLIWNLMGVGAFVGQAFITDEALSAMTEAQRALYESTPQWLNVIFGIAVLTGLLGCIALLMKKSWGVLMFVVSIIAVLIQNFYSWFATDAIDIYGSVQGVIMPCLIIALGGFLLYYSRSCRSKGWLS